MRRIIALGIAVALAGCAATSAVTAIGPNKFMMSKQAATGFSGLGNLKAEVLGEANAYCSKSGKAMEVLGSTESQPPYVFGNYPRVEVQFTCH